MKGPLAIMLGLAFMPFMLSVEQGAATSCYVVANPAAENVTGKYFANCAETRTSARGQDAELAARLWEVSEKLVA